MQNKPPSTLIIFRQPPYASDINKAGIDYALAASVFEQNISCLFMNKGVLQLIKGQTPEALQQKTIEKMLQAFSLYDIEKLYIDADAIDHYQLKSEQLCLGGEFVNKKKIQDLIQQHQYILTF